MRHVRANVRFVDYSYAPQVAPTEVDTQWCLSQSGTTLGSCLWVERPHRVTTELQTQALAAKEGVNYLDITLWFCSHALRPSVSNNLLPYADGSHVTAQYSTFLAPDLAVALNVGETVTVQPRSSASSSTPSPSSTSTTPTTLKAT